MDLQIKYPLLLSDLNQTWIFSTYFRKKSRILNFMKIRPAGTELLHAQVQADTQTDMAKPRATFRNFATAPNNELYVMTSKQIVRNKWGSKLGPPTTLFKLELSCYPAPCLGANMRPEEILQWDVHVRCGHQYPNTENHPCKSVPPTAVGLQWVSDTVWNCSSLMKNFLPVSSPLSLDVHTLPKELKHHSVSRRKCQMTQKTQTLCSVASYVLLLFSFQYDKEQSAFSW
jgi:hypothetical protein